ncbi:MAG: YraN family protein [Blautia sp.]|nr:YraN family protein [Blautia sp.]
MNKRRTGSLYEQTAADFLKSKGLRILQKNFRCRSGEIDLVARDGRYLVFVEVKYRRTKHQGEAVCAVDLRKQQKILDTAGYYLLVRHLSADTPCRFDVVGIDGQKIHWIRNAFMGQR